HLRSHGSATTRTNSDSSSPTHATISTPSLTNLGIGAGDRAKRLDGFVGERRGQRLAFRHGHERSCALRWLAPPLRLPPATLKVMGGSRPALDSLFHLSFWRLLDERRIFRDPFSRTQHGNAEAISSRKL